MAKPTHLYYDPAAQRCVNTTAPSAYDDYYLDITGSTTYLCDADGSIETRTYAAPSCAGDFSSTTETPSTCSMVPSSDPTNPPYYTSMVCTAVVSPPTPVKSSSSVTIDFIASQVINGCAYADYSADKATYDAALSTAIAKSCGPNSGIEPSFVHDLNVVPNPGAAADQQQQQLARGLIGQASLLVTYRVTGPVFVSGLTTMQVMADLEAAVLDGTFNEDLQTAALNMGAKGFEGATSSSITVKATPSQSGGRVTSSTAGTQAVSPGAAAGIAFAIIFAVLALGSGLYYYKKRNIGRGEERAIEMYATKNAMFGGVMGGGGGFDPRGSRPTAHLGSFGDLHQDRSSTGSYGENTGLSITRKDNIPDPMQYTGKRLQGLQGRGGNTTGLANL